MILFHHRALIGCRAWICTKSVGVKTRYAAVTPRGNELARRAEAPSEGWWPARVTRPVLRIKSPLHHFNACRPKIGSPSRSLKSEGWSACRVTLPDPALI